MNHRSLKFGLKLNLWCFLQTRFFKFSLAKDEAKPQNDAELGQVFEALTKN